MQIQLLEIITDNEVCQNKLYKESDGKKWCWTCWTAGQKVLNWKKYLCECELNALYTKDHMQTSQLSKKQKQKETAKTIANMN